MTINSTTPVSSYIAASELIRTLNQMNGTLTEEIIPPLSKACVASIEIGSKEKLIQELDHNIPILTQEQAIAKQVEKLLQCALKSKMV